ncbi:hypothetical protein P3X46_017735 [Hevea brasiliensis]|uniref:glucan endo-1,3-beta-D-glucosidase n=1 Tax=Hevea brasiliensis TaxID=3981 RepID=A0ABQ9LSQ8_HEVBR|nr:hypothetical protein P3X46_017735 [Hevea brasiliensis]
MLMWIQHFFFLYLFPPASLLFIILPNSIVGAPVGICYGRVASNLPPPSTVVNLLKSNGINDVRIFDADPETLLSFSGTGISLMVGVPNESLPSLANGNADTSAQWLQSNIFAYIPATQVKYIAVGNEVFLKDPFFTPYVVPALLNLYHALEILNLGNSIKLSSPQAASVLSSSYPPSSGMFDPYLESVIVPLLQFLYDKLDYALFKSRNPMQDGALEYRNLLDASVDALVYAMERERFSGIKVVVTETGWPTAGGEAASVENALAYNKEVVRRVVNDVGTPKRPREGMEAYLFSVYDENGKNGEDYEKHFGIFGLDGNKVYDLSFS